MNRILALAAVAGIAGIAQAQNTVTFDVEVSSNGSDWQENVAVNTLDATNIFVRVVLRGALAGSTDIIGLPGGTISNFPISNTLAGDAASATAGRFAASSPASNIALRNPGTATAAIDRSTVSNNITFQNLAPNFGGAAGNDVVFMTYTLNLAASAASRTLELGIGNLTNIAIYTTAGGSSSSATGVKDGATITIVPAPGALALAGLGGLVAGRRRR